MQMLNIKVHVCLKKSDLNLKSIPASDIYKASVKAYKI